MKKQLRIAIADDEPDILDYLQKAVVRLGHKVVVAARNGRELVEQCQVARPDLVLTDIQMPELDGIEAAGRIYQQVPTPIILVSSHFDAALIERAEGSPVQAYLVKPVQSADLEPTMALALRRFAQLRELEEALGRVKQLHGLLPICCYCKRIRDDRNYWQQVEAYIAAHSAASFSHSICPDCYEHRVKPELAAAGIGRG